MTGPLTRATSINQADGFVVYSASNIGFYYVPYDVVFDAFTSATVTTALNAGPLTINNIAVASACTSNTLVVRVTQGDGTTAPDSSSNTFLSFSDPVTDSSKFNVRTITSTITATIPQGATLGMVSARDESIHVYLIDNFGANQELAFATEDLFDEARLWSTTALTAASTSRTTLYSTTARSNVPIRFIGKIMMNQATAGTYVTAPTGTGGPNSDRSGIISGSANTTALTTATPLTICSIVIPPGIWDLSGSFAFNPTATTSMTDLQGTISSTDNTLFIGNSFDLPSVYTGQIRYRFPLTATPLITGNTNALGMAFPTYRFTTNTQVTRYLVVSATFTVSTLACTAWLQARRAKS